MSDIQIGDFVFTNKAMNADERGLAGYVTGDIGGNLLVETPEGSLSFQKSSITKVSLGDRVMILAPLHPGWSGEATVTDIHENGALVTVRPLGGGYAGVEGAFRPSEISLEILPAVPEPEPTDPLRDLARTLEGHANLAAEAAAYALALADTLDQIKENALV